jgi:coenzyme PQQ precursor peptide PqqA
LRIFPALATNAVVDNALEAYESGANVTRPQAGSAKKAGFISWIRDESITLKEIKMAWTKPEFTDLRFGFEVTMYIANR